MEVYFAPAHEPPTLRSILEPPPTLDADSPWLHIGHTTEDGLSMQAVDAYEEEHPVPAWEGPLRATMALSFELTKAFEVPVHLLGTPERNPLRPAVRVDYWLPTLQHAPWKQPGLTGRRYRIARRQFARARRDWIRAGRPRFKHSVYLQSADITLETP